MSTVIGFATWPVLGLACLTALIVSKKFASVWSGPFELVRIGLYAGSSPIGIGGRYTVDVSGERGAGCVWVESAITSTRGQRGSNVDVEGKGTRIKERVDMWLGGRAVASKEAKNLARSEKRSP
eukprot:6174249-Pleurochrysis_carterae.AAC.2